MRQMALPVDYEKCHMTINLPVFLDDSPMSNIRKMFSLMLRASWQNEDSIRALDRYLIELQEYRKARWNEMGIRFQRDYKDPAQISPYFVQDGVTKAYSKKQVASIRAGVKRKNRNMLDSVKRSKKCYERSQKVAACWDEVKSKYRCGE